jgi:dihydrofolate reductase
MTISIIVAIADNNAIGKNNDLLAYISADLKRFKQLTTGHAIAMGRKTFESLPNGALPNRTNIVLTHQPNYKAEGCMVVRSITEALQLCVNESEIFIIGGSSIYKAFIEVVNKLYITRIHKEFIDADTFFPVINFSDWSIESEENELVDAKTDIRYSYINYIRKTTNI